MATGWTVRGLNPGGGEIFCTCPDRLWGPPSLLYNAHRVFPGGKERPGRDAVPSPLLVPWSRKSRAIPLLPLWALRPEQSLSACTRVPFTFTFIYIYINRVSQHQGWSLRGPQVFVVVSFLFPIFLFPRKALGQTPNLPASLLLFI